MSRPWRSVAAAILLWAIFSLAILYLDPGSAGYWEHPVLCMRLVGRSAACELQQATLNDAWTRLHIIPLEISVLAGYVAIAALAIRGAVRRSRNKARVSDG